MPSIPRFVFVHTQAFLEGSLLSADIIKFQIKFNKIIPHYLFTIILLITFPHCLPECPENNMQFKLQSRCQKNNVLKAKCMEICHQTILLSRNDSHILSSSGTFPASLVKIASADHIDIREVILIYLSE